MINIGVCQNGHILYKYTLTWIQNTYYNTIFQTHISYMVVNKP